MIVRDSYVTCYNSNGYHRMHYTEWNPHPYDTGRPVVCVHGLTGRSSDFDRVAIALARKGRRVVCPDIVGRGRSDWLQDGEDYGYPQYLSDLGHLIARVDPHNQGVDWIGISLGGLLGMRIAGLDNHPIHRMVINDIGPYVPEKGLEPIYEYIQIDYSFPTLAHMADHLREWRQDIDLLNPTEFQRALGTTCRRKDDGTWTFNFDPAMIPRFLREPYGEVRDLWPLWDRTPCPVLLMRGADSELLLQETADEMQTRGPETTVKVYEGYGHIPTMVPDDQVADVVNFLMAEEDNTDQRKKAA